MNFDPQELYRVEERVVPVKLFVFVLMKLFSAWKTPTSIFYREESNDVYKATLHSSLLGVWVVCLDHHTVPLLCCITLSLYSGGGRVTVISYKPDRTNHIMATGIEALENLNTDRMRRSLFNISKQMLYYVLLLGSHMSSHWGIVPYTSLIYVLFIYLLLLKHWFLILFFIVSKGKLIVYSLLNSF